MPLYANFYPESVTTIEEALLFVIKRIEEGAAEKKKVVDEAHHALVDREYEAEISRLEEARTFLKEHAGGYGFFELDVKSHQSLMDIVRSALEVYLQDAMKAKAKTGLPGFDAKIHEIRRIISLGGPQIGKTDLFDRYYQAPIPILEGKRIEIFFSYANEDKLLAGKIASLLNKREIDVFLAHEDIEISKIWRNEILKHLKNDNFLLALLTPNCEKSVWANQEAGYMIGKGGKNIPLIVGETDVKKFGFLESFQGIPFEEENLEDCVNKIVSIILE
jgi:hypothetical protein